jgi:virginiamycin A acetyltransferase
MLELKWWDMPVEEINKLIPVLSDNNFENVKREIEKILALAKEKS